MYKSPYEAYPYLSEPADDLRCDYEMATDRLAVEIGLLRAMVSGDALKQDLSAIGDLVMHLNPSLRMGVRVTAEERDQLEARLDELQARTSVQGFVATEGTLAAMQAHRIRCLCKELVRLTYRHLERAGDQGFGAESLSILLDVPNLLSGYFFFVALTLNREAGHPERPFTSRHYRLDGTVVE